MNISPPKYADYDCPEKYTAAKVLWCEPMLAKEIEDEEKQDECLTSPEYYVEEKFDGTRALLHFFKHGTRCFSRRVSEKTGWFCENSDSLPHLRDINVPELKGTIIDGEMFIPNRPFKDVSAALNCTYDKAQERQEELGKIVFHAFDILYYKGVRVEMMPLHRRKVYLQRVIDTVNSPYIVLVDFYKCNEKIPLVLSNKKIEVFEKFMKSGKMQEKYPTLYKDLISCDTTCNEVTPRGYYEYIIATGGEGVIVKPINGKYYHKRGWEYSKIKKFLTREVIITGFNKPTKEYNGKFPDIYSWDYWETPEGEIFDLSDKSAEYRKSFKNKYFSACIPVSKFYAKNWIGTIRFGVKVSYETLERLREENPRVDYTSRLFHLLRSNQVGGVSDTQILEVGECSGFDEETRKYLSEHSNELEGAVIEVKANEIFNDTGKLRHPRFLRLRPDKSLHECTWEEHITQQIISD